MKHPYEKPFIEVTCFVTEKSIALSTPIYEEQGMEDYGSVE